MSRGTPALDQLLDRLEDAEPRQGHKTGPGGTGSGPASAGSPPSFGEIIKKSIVETSVIA